MSKPVIICVDDEKSVLNTLEEQLLTKLDDDFDVELAISGDEALELIEELHEDKIKIAAIISDQIMPGMKGDEFLIAAHKINPEIPKILLTGQASLVAVQNAINNAGLYRYISKPWEMNDLCMTVVAATQSYIQKQTIDSYGESIKLLKRINTATRKLSSEIQLDSLSSMFLSMAATYTKIDSFYIIFDNDDEVVIDAYDENEQQMQEILSLLKYDNKKLLQEVKANIPKQQGFIEKTDRVLIPLTAREEEYGSVFAMNRENKIIGETQFEMFKVLTKQFIVSYETAKLYKNIETQNELIEKKNKSIQHSLDYAQKIQEALLPNIEILQKTFPESFIWYSPKDTVSGDFYMFREVGENLFLVSADCTGHGVPGAFITILGRMILRELIRTGRNTLPSEILTQLDQRILNLFHKNGESEVRDGMDISIVLYNIPSKTFYFSGAKSNIYTINSKNGALSRVKGNRYEIGNYLFKDVQHKYESLKLDIDSGDYLYLMSDGIQDQFGGENASKIGLRKFQELISANYQLPMNEQKDKFVQFVTTWMGDNSQTDDISMIGIRVP